MRSQLKKLRSAIRLANAPHYDALQWFDRYLSSLGAQRSFLEKRPVTAAGDPLPWMTYAAIEYFGQIDFGNSFVFEYGSGYGSLYWAERARRVVSVEDNADWIDELQASRRANQTLIFAPDRRDYVSAIERVDERPDFVVIDGSHRAACAAAAAAITKPSPMIVLDNADRYPKTCAFLRDGGFLQYDFAGAGPINAYAWCTSIFSKLGEAMPFRRIHSAPQVFGGLADIDQDEA